MSYLKNFLIGFFIVFFANYLFPGIDVVNQTKIPHIGGDLIFAAGLGLLNSLIFPLLKALDRHLSLVRISVVALLLNFAAYVLLKLLPFGVFVTSVEGYLTASIAVSIGSILLGYAQLRHHRNKPPSHKPPETHLHHD